MASSTRVVLFVGLIVATVWATFATLDIPRMFPAFSRQVSIVPAAQEAVVPVDDVGALGSSLKREMRAADINVGAPDGSGVFPRFHRPPRFVGAPTLSQLRI